jgi:hypothetical protein
VHDHWHTGLGDTPETRIEFGRVAGLGSLRCVMNSGRAASMKVSVALGTDSSQPPETVSGSRSQEAVSALGLVAVATTGALARG